ncbi:MAG: CHASE domain-containing protein [bacterium]
MIDQIKFVSNRPGTTRFYRGYGVLVLAACLGILLSIFLFQTSMRWENRRIQSVFDKSAANHIFEFKKTIADNLHDIDALHSFYAGSQYVDRSEFHIYVQHLLSDNSAVQALVWAPRIPDSERNIYEEAAAREVVSGFHFTERNAQGVLVQAGRRDEYYPVYYVEPMQGSDDALGFDLASNPERLEAMNLARDTGNMVATERIGLILGKENKYGILAFRPVYRKDVPVDTVEFRRTNLVGFVAGAYSVGEMLEKSIISMGPQGMDIYIYDESASEGERLLYFHASRARKESVQPIMDETELRSGIYHEDRLKIGDKTWRMLCRPTPDYVHAARTWEPWRILAVGLIFTALISGYLLLNLVRMKQIKNHVQLLSKAKKALEQEINERRQAEEVLRESEERFRQLTEAAFDGIAFLESGVFIEVNESFAAMFGYEVPELVGMPVSKTVAPEDLDNVKKKISEGYDRPYESVGLKKNGNRFPLEVSAKTIRSKGRILRMASIRDITARKKLEEELLKSEKLESLGVLAGGLAHDFNNLLTAILGNIDLATLVGKMDDKTSEILKEAKNASLRARDLTQQLLTFAKGGAPIRKTASIRRLVEDTVRFALRGSNVKYEMVFSDDLMAVDMDEGQISQAIGNLIINADQAMPQGGKIQVRADMIKIGPEDLLPIKQGDHIRISIQDQGGGIQDKYLDRIFDPYFTTKQKGSGLGLAMVFSIIKRHDGHVAVESKLGAGSTFTIYLPASNMKLTVGTGDHEEEIIKGRGRVLVMDDEEVVRKVLGEMLNHLGYEVWFAEEGSGAIDIYQRARDAGEPFDAVILDLTIPGGMGGRETIAKLREIDHGVKAIVSSGYAIDPIMSNYREYGFCDMIAKPYKVQDLGLVLHQVIIHA